MDPFYSVCVQVQAAKCTAGSSVWGEEDVQMNPFRVCAGPGCEVHGRFFSVGRGMCGWTPSILCVCRSRLRSARPVPQCGGGGCACGPLLFYVCAGPGCEVHGRFLSVGEGDVLVDPFYSMCVQVQAAKCTAGSSVWGGGCAGGSLLFYVCAGPGCEVHGRFFSVGRGMCGWTPSILCVCRSRLRSAGPVHQPGEGKCAGEPLHCVQLSEGKLVFTTYLSVPLRSPPNHCSHLPFT